jgi:mannose-6-phosphate isomerase
MSHRPTTESDIGRWPRQLDRAPEGSGGPWRDRTGASEWPRSVPGTGHDEAMGSAEFDERPWGSFFILDDAEDHKVKRMVVRPGKRLSYQRHARRSEHWFVVHGRGVVTIDGVQSEVTPGTAVDIPVTAAHRIENDGTEDLVFIEVQHGEYFGEDDIVRLEDDFGRVPTGG